MNGKYIDLSKQLLEERETYVKYREEAVRLSAGIIDSELRAVTVERIQGTGCSHCQCRPGVENNATLMRAPRCHSR